MEFSCEAYKINLRGKNTFNLVWANSFLYFVYWYLLVLPLVCFELFLLLKTHPKSDLHQSVNELTVGITLACIVGYFIGHYVYRTFTFFTFGLSFFCLFPAYRYFQAFTRIYLEDDDSHEYVFSRSQKIYAFFFKYLYGLLWLFLLFKKNDKRVIFFNLCIVNLRKKYPRAYKVVFLDWKTDDMMSIEELFVED